MNLYQKWLGISAGTQSPDFFQLLGIQRDERDLETIKSAARSQLRKLQPHRSGPDAERCQKLIARVKKAYQVVSNPELREEYLQRLMAAEQAPSGPPQGSANRRGRLIPAIAAAAATLVLVGVAHLLWAPEPSPDRTASSTPSAMPQPELKIDSSAPPAASVAEDIQPKQDLVDAPKTTGHVDASQLATGQVEPTPTASPTAVSVAPATSATDLSDTELPPTERSPQEKPNNTVTTATDFATDTLAQSHQARAVLETHCFRCHGEDETDEGGFGFALNREKLISAGYVRPRDADQSLLLQRMTSAEAPMPPEGEQPRPSAEETSIVRNWIRSGADPFEDAPPTPFLTNEAKYRLIAADLERAEKRDRVYLRYFTIDHLASAGYSSDELGVYRKALAKLLNSLSCNRRLAELNTVGDQQSIFRIDMRDLKWSSDSWNRILQGYPYGVLFDVPDALYVREETGCEVPIIRADWFVATASRPPLYHTLAQIPSTDRELESLLRVDASQNIDQARVIRVGFARSGVSQHNRMIERHESIFGAYWKSYDFAGSSGRKNLFENPLGPGAGMGTFAQDGGEIIFHLPNGMLAYMLTDGAGNRIDKGPTTIVSDPRQPDRAVVNGVSCMSCHYAGLIRKTDEIQKHVQANLAAYPRHQDIFALYGNDQTAESLFESDTQRYLTALSSEQIQMPRPTRAGEPIVLVSSRYQNEIDIRLAAAEFGLPLETFTAEIGNLSAADLIRKIGVWKTTGGVVKRETLHQVFGRIVQELELGETALLQTPVAAKQPVQDIQPAGPRLLSLPFGTNPVAADAAMAAAQQAAKSRDWKKAETLFQTAIQTAVNRNYRIRACEQAIPVFERSDQVALLIDSHKIILDACRNPAEIERAKTNLFASLIRFIKKSEPWSRPDPSRMVDHQIDWGTEFPSAVSNSLAMTFEPQLQKTPEHEATLRVLQIYYQHVHDLPEKRLPILVQLKENHRKRGAKLDLDSESDLAALLAASGENTQAAENYSSLGNQFTGAKAAAFFLSEAKCWIAADESPKAKSALNKSYKQCLSDQQFGIGVQLVQIGDAYQSINQTEGAIECYKRALRLEQNPTQSQLIQQKLAKLVASSVPAVAPPQVEESMEDLLDPKRKFRLEAQNLERQTSGSAASVFSAMTAAADAWIKAEDMENANKAQVKAAAAGKRIVDYSTPRNHAQLAELFRRIHQNQKALDYYLLALKSSSNVGDIEKHQIEIVSLMESDSTLTIPEDSKKLVDAQYKYRFQAQQAEGQEFYSPENRTTNLVRACGYWNQAGDKEDVVRSGLLAESSIEKMASDSPRSRQERHYASLAKIYVAAELHQPAVRCLIAALGFTSSDDQAVKYHHQAKTIADQQGIAMPNLDDQSAAKLDPLNRYRVQARKDEQDAAQQTGATALYQLMSASKNWIKADETVEAIRTANLYARQLMKDSTDSRFEHQCVEVGDLFVQLGRSDAARKCYQEAIKVCKYESRKKRIQKKLDALTDVTE